MAYKSFSKIVYNTGSHTGDIICLLPVLNIISLTLVPKKFNKSTEQLLNRTTTEIPSPRKLFIKRLKLVLMKFRMNKIRVLSLKYTK